MRISSSLTPLTRITESAVRGSEDIWAAPAAEIHISLPPKSHPPFHSGTRSCTHIKGWSQCCCYSNGVLTKWSCCLWIFFVCVSVRVMSCSAARKSQFLDYLDNLICRSLGDDFGLFVWKAVILLLSVPLKLVFCFSPNRKISSTAFGRWVS